jgi:chemotaxis protein CheX
MTTPSPTNSAVRSDEELLPLLEVASHEVFRLMVGAELQRGSQTQGKGSEFTAMVGLAGELCGVLSVRCGKESANLVAALMLGLAPEKAAEHAWDALGEVANMIAGNFKNKLNGTSDKCMLSVPTVITGADYTFRSLAVANPMALWFTFQDMPLAITLEVQSER